MVCNNRYSLNILFILDCKLNRNSLFLFYTLLVWSESYRMSNSSCARQRARSSFFIVSESLFPIRSHRKYDIWSRYISYNTADRQTSAGPERNSFGVYQTQPVKSFLTMVTASTILRRLQCWYDYVGTDFHIQDWRLQCWYDFRINNTILRVCDTYPQDCIVDARLCT